MKIIFLLSMILSSASAFAISEKKLLQLCNDIGVTKVVEQAEAYGVTVKRSSVKACDVSRGFLVSYVWYCAFDSSGHVMRAPNGEELIKMTQKSLGYDCF